MIDNTETELGSVPCISQAQYSAYASTTSPLYCGMYVIYCCDSFQFTCPKDQCEPGLQQSLQWLFITLARGIKTIANVVIHLPEYDVAYI